MSSPTTDVQTCKCSCDVNPEGQCVCLCRVSRSSQEGTTNWVCECNGQEGGSCVTKFQLHCDKSEACSGERETFTCKCQHRPGSCTVNIEKPKNCRVTCVDCTCTGRGECCKK